MPKVILKDIRCSYVFVQSPRKKDDGEDGKYGVQLLIPKDSPQLKALKAAILEALEAKHGAEALKKKGRYKLPLRDGDEERDGEEYEGMYFMNANAGKKPGIVNRHNNIPSDAELEELCYSGATFHVSVNVYGFPAKDGGKPGVAVGLNNIMLRKAGDRLDGSVSASSEFEEFAEAGGNSEFDDDDF